MIVEDIDWESKLAEDELTDEEQKALEVALNLCQRVKPNFMPNIILDLSWPEAVSSIVFERDLEWYLAAFELMCHGCNWSPLEHSCTTPYLAVTSSKRKITKCRLWTCYDEKAIDVSVVDNLAYLWSRFGGTCEQLAVGDGAIYELATIFIGEDKKLSFWFPDFSDVDKLREQFRQRHTFMVGAESVQ